MRHSTKPPNAEEAERLARIKELGCLACRIRGLWPERGFQCGHPEAHHLIRAGRRIGHHASVCLGAWHHRGVLMNPGDSAKQMLLCYGPSLARGPAAFHVEFGDDVRLLQLQNELLAAHGFDVKEPPPRRRTALSSSKVLARTCHG